jgi:cellulose synthase (UDP-forming)
MRPGAWLLVTLPALACACAARDAGPSRSDRLARERDELSALWSLYRYTHVQDGRVVELDEGGVTTSEGQSYAMLRAVWAGDRETFESVWRWTKEHLQVREDRLLAWRWKDRVLDRNAATDADQDAALALVLAARRFGEARFLDEARGLLADIWAKEVVVAAGRPFPTGGNWAPAERWPTIHVAYLAPYAYEVFAGVDPARPWRALVRSSYDLLRFLYVERGLDLPPDVVFLDPRSGAVLLDRPGGGGPSASGYDAVPIFWRVALDARWFGRRGEADLRARMLRAPRESWRAEGRLRDRATATGRPLSDVDGLPLLASVQALAQVVDPTLAADMRGRALDGLFERALAGDETPYYLHNWLWFGRALELGAVRRFDEPLSFLLLLDWTPFRETFPVLPVAAGLLLAPFARRRAWARGALLALCLGVSARYLGWRVAHTLNFVEPLGPLVSLSLLGAELYAFSTIALLAAQVGLRGRARAAPAPLADDEPHPTVDVLVPIYSESLEILDRTLAACAALRWPDRTIWVCDDSHRPEVAALAAEHGARYLRGPRRHAKAGNLNAALAVTSGELVVIFDTDHVPEARFLERTVPWFRDPRMGVVQTPHHFTNPDVFQRAFGGGEAVPGEADLFNHAIQGARDAWGGAFFVGSGAVFRRAALASVGGFHLLSITEDIHTSQKLHARGWRSAFVPEDLAAGLSAETFQAYLVQRRRWMLGCLQIFFRDNPLLQRGLPLRHRVGYFASLWYFFFPLARVVFFATPLWFLLFHLHPLFADLPVLLAYLVPHLVLAPLAASALVPGWPRLLWGGVYESAVAFPLARAALDLVLPRRLGFKVTPKGITTDRRRFDASSSALTLAAAAVAVLALAKGAFELAAFGIEVEAYAFNLGWAAVNLAALVAALLVAWERPQRRAAERIRARLPVRIGAQRAEVVDLSTSGVCLRLAGDAPLPPEVEVIFDEPEPLRLVARVVWRERAGGEERAGLAFVDADAAARRSLVRIGFARPGVHDGAHARRARSQLGMAAHLVAGLVRVFLPERARRRLAPRRRALAVMTLVGPGRRVRALRLDAAPGGLGLLALGAPPAAGAALPLLLPDGVRWARVAHARRVAPGVWRLGLAYLPAPVAGSVPGAYLAA